jgi:hypothetical protein
MMRTNDPHALAQIAKSSCWPRADCETQAATPHSEPVRQLKRTIAEPAKAANRP